MANNEQVVDLPDGFCQLHTQVAGHMFQTSNLGLLQDAADGCVLKPLGKPECGVRELNFYESLAKCRKRSSNGGSGDCDDDFEQGLLLAELANYVPQYYEKQQLVVNGSEHTFVKLENLTRGMSKPCVMDVKIGKRTWDPMSSPHKRAVEEQKYVLCKQNLGLCLPGFQVYLPVPTSQTKQPSEQTMVLRHGKDYGKSLSVAGFSQAMALFLYSKSDSKNMCVASNTLVHEVLRQLRQIQCWFKQQRLMHFYASSLLICYDFAELQRLSNNSKQVLNGHIKPTDQHQQQQQQQHQQEERINSKNPSEWVRVRMIDFAHVYPAENGEPDHNYMFGLDNLINVVQSTQCR